MQIDQKVDYIEFPCGDLDAVQSFYEKTFGWTFMDYGPEYRAFTDGKIDGGFRRADQYASTKNGAPLIILYADNLESTRDKVVASGGTIIQDDVPLSGRASLSFRRPEQQRTGRVVGQVVRNL